ncbi:MAG TPA: autotransporter-associated beta strand repeat-containing protein [Caulobacteraceae bacterium]|jgi:autotransporter-associated beta strand protein|nr:autotransporter-associated beta strand repeat-containing protein [Caulobacteraceae bacterium]
MTATKWANGVSGNWKDATKWEFGLVPTATDDVTIDNAGIFTVSVSTVDRANSLTFDAANATLSELSTGSLKIGGAFNLEAGTVLLRHANSFGSVDVTGGRLETFVGTALGGAALTLDGGEFSGMANQTIGNALALGGTGTTIDAATGTTLHIGAGSYTLDDNSMPTITFGSSARRGVVDWHTGGVSIIFGSGNYAVDVAGGTLKAGDKDLGFLLGNAISTTVATGAEIDLNGFSALINTLEGAGSVANAGAEAVLTLAISSDFNGVISGNLSVEISAGSFLGGVNTYTGATIIDSGGYLVTFNHGSVAGAIIDNGALYDEDSGGTFTTGLISGSGLVELAGPGTMVFDHANTFSGGANLIVGTALIGSGKGLGTGLVTVDRAKLIGTASETMKNAFTLRGATTIAAATGTTLTLTGGSMMTFDAGATPLNLVFGEAAHAGTVVIGGGSGESVNATNPISIKVAYGKLKAVGGDLASVLADAHDVTVAAGATLDVGGVSTITPMLTSAGSITNSSVTLATLQTQGASSVSGVISGKLAVSVFGGSLKLTGVDTYTGGTTIAGGAALTLAGAGSIKGNVDDGGTLTIDDTGPLTLAGVISGAGSLTDAGAGALTLSGANTFTGGSTLLHGELIVTNGKALGTQGLTLDNQTKLVSTATMTLAATGAGTFTFNGNTTIAAAHGTTLTIGGSEAVQVNAGTLNFGQAGDDGVIVFTVSGGSDPGPFSMNVNDGTLKAGDAIFGDLTLGATSVGVAAGATLDLNGFAVIAHKLTGTGTVTDSGAVATFTLVGGSFAGTLAGRLALTTYNVTLTGTNTYTGGTTVNSGYTLQLGAGGATGSIVGNIADGGTLAIDRSGALTLGGVISGAGAVDQKGPGTSTLDGNSSYTGGTTIARGELISGRSAALGTGGTITMTGGELLASASQTLSHDVSLGGLSTLAAATGATLIIDSGSVTLNAGTTYFGDSTHAGTIVWNISNNLNTNSAGHLEIRDGTLKIGTGAGSNLTGLASPLRIDSGGTLDMAGQLTAIQSLTGAGILTNSGPSADIILRGVGNFGGVISGHIHTVFIDGDTTLSGDETFTGTFALGGGDLTLSGLVAENIDFGNPGTLVLVAPSRFTGVIEDFGSGATVDLRNITAGTAAVLAYDTGTGVLTIKDGTHTDKVKFASGLVLGNFVASADGSGGTDIGWQTPPAAARSPLPVPASALKAATNPPTPARLVDTMASMAAPYTAATMLIPPPMALQPALATGR